MCSIVPVATVAAIVAGIAIVIATVRSPARIGGIGWQCKTAAVLAARVPGTSIAPAIAAVTVPISIVGGTVPGIVPVAQTGEEEKQREKESERKKGNNFVNKLNSVSKIPFKSTQGPLYALQPCPVAADAGARLKPKAACWFSYCERRARRLLFPIAFGRSAHRLHNAGGGGAATRESHTQARENSSAARPGGGLNLVAHAPGKECSNRTELLCEPRAIACSF